MGVLLYNDIDWGRLIILDGIMLYADRDITNAVEKALLESGISICAQKAESYSDCLGITPQHRRQYL
jgi:hypothetical protein